MTSNEETIEDIIGGAEEVDDLLEGLVEKTGIDPSAPFIPEVLAALAALKRDDRAAFEKLRAQLKDAGCRMKALDEALDEDSGDTGGRGPPQVDILLDLAQTAELFHTADSTCFADLDIDGHRETWPICSKGFKRWLARRYFERTDSAPNSEALKSALNVIEAKAHFDAPERLVYIRVGGSDGRIYLDLCDATWRAVEIDSAGWRVINTPPVRFRRAAGMLPLPMPVVGGSIVELSPFLNLRSNNELGLAVSWVLGALRDRGPYPILAIFGASGTAKTTVARILRSLVDPNILPLRTLPRDDRDLFIAASNAHVLGFDNISFLEDWISDTLCRLSTGGGFATRALYSDQDEVLLDAIRPTILNGIEEVVNRPDLADRAIFLTLERISDDKRRPEEELWADFEAVRPRILGALLDAVALGLERLPGIQLKTLPRMADFAIWASACETALQDDRGAPWQEGTFATAYSGNIDEAVESVLEANTVATAVRNFMAIQTTWAGTATDLLPLLERVAGEKTTRAKTWPVDATRLGGRLRRAATFLREVGIEISVGKREGHARTRIITITTIPQQKEDGNTAAASNNSTHTDTNGSGGACANPLKNKDKTTTNAEPRPLEGAVKTAPPSLSDVRIREFAQKYIDAAIVEVNATGDIDSTTLDGELRQTLVNAGVLPELVEAEFKRIMAVVMAS